MAEYSVKLQELFPCIPSRHVMFMLEAMTYKVTAQVLKGDPLEITVQAWTNQYDQDNNEGSWHEVPLAYIGEDSPGCYTYGASVIITSNVDFQYTFRYKVPGENVTWTWTHGYGENGYIQVDPAREYDDWTQGPNFDKIFGTLHCGNFIAATNAKKCGLTHVLNVADNLDMIYPHGEEVHYKKVAMQDGAHNCIPDHLIAEAVQWLLDNDSPGHAMLVNCRAGIGRAGSVAVAYVFAKCPSLTYEQVIKHVSSCRFIYPHRGLRDTLYKLYPREE